MRRLPYIVVIALAVAACAPQDSATSIPTTAASQPGTSESLTTAPADEPDQGDSPCLTGDRPFASAGVISAFGGTSGDATQISGIRWADHPGCERIVVDLLTADGAPAGALGPVGVDYDETIGIVRVNLPNAVTRTAIADSLVDGDLVDRVFVVRTGNGNLAIDIHVAPGAAVALRAFEVAAPSRITIDLKPDSESTPVIGAISAADMVVLTPAPGPAQLPLVVAGYTRGFEARVVAYLHDDREAAALAEESTLASDWADMWGEFTITFDNPPQQSLELFVGSESARGGDLQGIWVVIDTSIAGEP